jgi:hypothetical protein
MNNINGQLYWKLDSQLRTQINIQIQISQLSNRLDRQICLKLDKQFFWPFYRPLKIQLKTK